MMNQNKIAAYGLLAHINDSQSGIKNLNDIFEPLIKRVLSKMNSNGLTKGVIDDIKNNVDKEYSLDIPYPILRAIVKRISNKINSKNDGEFVFHDDGSFIVKNFVFYNYEDVMIKQEGEIELLEKDYLSFIIENNVEPNTQPTIFDFLDKNKIALGEYFVKKHSFENGHDYLLQAKYINSRKTIPELYDILKRVYLGSVISSYLVLDVQNEKPLTKLEFLFDTNFITAILDLNSKEAHHTAIKIIEICQRLGYKMTILDLTIEETRNLIERTAQNFEDTYLTKKINQDSIYSACERKGLSKTSIQNIAYTFDKDLNSKYGIFTIPNSQKFQNIAKYSKDYQLLSSVRNDKRSALHDATAITYIKEKRNNKHITDFHKANCWFVSIVQSETFLLKREKNVSEIIRAVDLVNLLWLTNPNVKSNDIVEIGLSRLVANTISKSLPSPRLLNELEENFRYAKKELSTDIIVRVANSVATDTLENIEKLNEKGKKDKTQFIKELKERDLELQAQLEKQKEEFENMKSSLQSNYDQKIDETTNKLNTNFDERLNAELSNIKNIFNDNILEIKTEYTKKEIDLKEQIQQKFKEDELKKKHEEYERINKSILRFKEDSKQFANILNISLLILFVLIPIIIALFTNNYYFLIGLILPLIVYILFVSIFKQKIIQQQTEDKCSKFLDMEHFLKLSKELFSEKNVLSNTYNIGEISGDGNNISGEIKSINQKYN